jgi:hypothetical protein
VADQREAILTRLVEVCGAVTGVQAAARNKLDVPALARPAVIVQDGSEDVLDAPQGTRGSRVQRMELKPLVVVIVRGDNGAEAGSLLTLYRSRIVAAVLTDSVLLDCVVDRDIRYEGATVAAPDAEAREYRCELNLVFTSLFRLSDLAGV